MRLSAKGRYGLAAMTNLAVNHSSGNPVTIISISERLGISKIYLEQVFSLLKRAQLVSSIKGSQGGYQLTREPRDITVYDILAAIELALIEETGASSAGKVPELEAALSECVYKKLDEAILATLSAITLEDIVTETEKKKDNSSMMYFI